MTKKTSAAAAVKVMWWVDENGQVVSLASPTGLPANIREIEGVDLPLPNIYFNGTEVVEKPPQPSGNAEWDAVLKDWITPSEPQPQPPPPQPDYYNFRLGMLVATMWNALIDELEEKPKAAEVKSWNAIAQASNVPIKFGKDGKMNLA
jgi:hypothetical protein